MSGILNAFTGGSYGSPPANTVAPAVTGTPTDRQTLSTTDGTWTGVPTPTFTYQWYRSPSTVISGATANTYVLTDADVGSTIYCKVTATNAISSVSANSNTTATVASTVPGAPTIGTATVLSSSSVSVTFTAPSSTGGSTITGYTVYASSGGFSASGSSSPITVTGLNSETSYYFYAVATNANGNSANSGNSNTVTTSPAYWLAFVNQSYSGANALRGGSDSNGANIIIGGGGYGNTPQSRISKSGTWVSGASTSTNNYIYPQNPPQINSGGQGRTLAGYTNGSGSEIYGGGYQYSPGVNGHNGFAISKVDASGNQSWFNNQTYSGSTTPCTGIQLGEDGYIYATGYRSSGQAVFTKWSTGGTLQWYKWGQDSSAESTSICGNGSYTFLSQAYANQAGFAAWDSSMTTRTWSAYIYDTNGYGGVSGVQSICSSGGYIYAAMAFQNTSIWSSGITCSGFMKINGSTGAVVWSRWCAPTSTSNTSWASDIIVGSDGYVYCSTYCSSNKIAVTKVDTSGNVQWQRRFYSNSSTGYIVNNSTVSITGSSMYISTMYSIPNNAPLLIKVPTDGSKTGSYSASFNGATYVYDSFSSWNDLSGYFDLNTSNTWNTQNISTTNYNTGNTTGANSVSLNQLINI
jgi:hypothetical protein